MKIVNFFLKPAVILTILIIGVYWQFFLQGKIPIPGDTLLGAYYPWYEHDWGYIAGVPIKNAPISDTYSQFLPWKYFAVEQLSKGEFPLWNPYVASGTPFLATYHSSALNPFNLILLLPKYYGWGLFVFGQTMVAALGMYFLLRQYTKDNFAAIAGSVVFCFSGLMTNWVEFGTGVWAAGMLPWIFYFLHKFWEFQKTRYLCLMAASFAVLFLSGHAQLTVYSSVLFFIYLAFKLFNDESKLNLKIFLPGVFYALAVGIALIQLLPSYDVAKASIRAGEEYSRQFSFGLNAYYEVIRLISADFFGNPTTGNHWDNISYHEQSSFLGTLSLPIIFPLMFKQFRKTKYIAFWGAVFIASLVLAIDSPLTRFLYSQPLPFLTYSSASRIFFITSLSAAILVGFGVNNIQDLKYRLYLRNSFILFLVLLTTVALGIAGYLNWIKDSDLSTEKITTLTTNFNVSLKNLMVPIGILATAVMASFISERTNLFLKKWQVLLLIIITLLYLDLGRYFLKYNPFVEHNFVFPTTPSIEYLQTQKGLFRIATLDEEVLPANSWMVYGLSSVSGYDPMLLENYAHYFHRTNNAPFEHGVSRYMILKDFNINFLNSLNVKYFVGLSRNELAIPGEGITRAEDKKLPLKRVFLDKNTVVSENPNFVERVYVPQRMVNVSKDEFLVRINSVQFDPTKEVISSESDFPTKEVMPAKIEITDYKPNSVVLKSFAENESFAVLADTYEKGWKLYANGKEVPIYEVNGALRGFEIPQGETIFKFFYWPKSFDIGLKAAIVSIVIIILFCGYSFKKKVW